ncbi:MAG TPA: hypothetical protein VF761_17040 [Gemmatimonadaceae bacterium]
MDSAKLLGIIRILVGGEDCYAPTAFGADNFVSQHCTNPVTHIGTSGDARCSEHLSHFTDRGEEFVALEPEP